MTSGFAENMRVGFSPLDSLPHEGSEASSCLGLDVLQAMENERILLLSNLGNNQSKSHIKKRKKRARTKNNKRVSLSMTITHDGVVYPINNAPSYGVYLRMLHKFLEQLDICIAKWRRVFVIRFDLHQRWYTDKNKMITKFRNNLTRRLERAYEVFEVGYIWSREHEKSKQQHYHFALFIDGDKVNHSAKISEMIRETWERVKVGNTAHIPKSCFYNVVDFETKLQAVERLSYLAKQRGKGYRPPQTKDYGTSRLTASSLSRFKIEAPQSHQLAPKNVGE